MNYKFCQKIGLICLLTCLINGCSANPSIEQYRLSDSVKTTYRKLGMELLSVYEIHNPDHKQWLYEFSDLAWNPDEQELWSVTDTGHIVIFKPYFNNEHLESIAITEHSELLDQNFLPLDKDLSDSEGITLLHHQNNIPGDTECLISFENVPRIIRYKKNGSPLVALKLPEMLNDVSNYQGRNKQLESVAFIPRQSKTDFITAPERPLKNAKPGVINIFNQNGKLTDFKLANTEHGSIVALTELVNEDLMALERVYRNQFSSLGFHLHYLSSAKQYQVTKRYDFDPNAALINDNFEGLAHISDNHFFMVSDDNQNALQRTLLVYFKLLQ